MQRLRLLLFAGLAAATLAATGCGGDACDKLYDDCHMTLKATVGNIPNISISKQQCKDEIDQNADKASCILETECVAIENKCLKN